MKTCFTALLVEFVAVAQFVYPLHDIHPNAECAKNLDSWVKYQKLLETNKRDDEPFRGLYISYNLYGPYNMGQNVVIYGPYDIWSTTSLI